MHYVHFYEDKFIRNILQFRYAGQKKEVFPVFHLNAKHRLNTAVTKMNDFKNKMDLKKFHYFMRVNERRQI